MSYLKHGWPILEREQTPRWARWHTILLVAIIALEVVGLLTPSPTRSSFEIAEPAVRSPARAVGR